MERACLALRESFGRQISLRGNFFRWGSFVPLRPRIIETG
jgi:hypothetical protein